MNNTTTFDEWQLDLKTWQEAVIPLEPDDIDRAIQLSQPIPTEARQWQTYLKGLALYGLVQWLGDRVQAPIQLDNCSILQPSYANVLDAVCHLTVGDFTLCLLVIDRPPDGGVPVSRAVVELPELVAHFYLLLEVQEEQEQLILRGCLRYDQLIQGLLATEIHPSADWHYRVPLNWFDSDANHLVFYLQFLDPATVRLPAPARSLRTRLAGLQPELEERLPQLHPEVELWQVLTWEQASALLTCPPLLNLVYLWQHQLARTMPIAQHFREVLHRLTGQAVNVWHWSHTAVDELTQSFAWAMPQPLTATPAMRRTSEKVEVALRDLIQRQAIEIPSHAYYSYKNVEATDLQLCAVTWSSASTMLSNTDNAATETESWALLLVLVAQPGSVLPPGTRLQVGITTILAEAVLETDDLYLYILVEGDRTEEFVVTILLPDRLPVTLPTFVCHPDE